jgi:hypothetical protein
MFPPTSLAEAFERNIQIIKMQTEGLSQGDSLVQLPFRGNCMNWVVGHIVTNRNSVLELLGVEQPPNADLVARYKRESEPICAAGPDVLPLDRLIELLELAQAQIAGLLAEATPEELKREVAFFGRRSMPVSEWLLFFYFHDTYHTGQTEILRQAAGKNDVIIR